jgi:rhodanese-related sulfurtransferase
MREITVKTLAEWLAQGDQLTLLDVREEWEFALGTIGKSVHLPLGQLGQLAQSDDADQPDSDLCLRVGLPHDKTVITICHHGVRSLHAAAILQSKGFTRVFSLKGGTDAWSREIDRTLPRY